MFARKKFFLILFLAIVIISFFYLGKFFLNNNNKITEGVISLSKNQKISLNKTSLELAIADIKIPLTNCRDCLTYLKIKVKKGKEEKELEFKIGSIAGYLINTQEAFGYRFILEKIVNNNVKIRYIKI